MIYVESRSGLRPVSRIRAHNEGDHIWSPSLYYRSEMRAAYCYGVVVPGVVVLGVVVLGGGTGTVVGWAVGAICC